MKTSLLTRTAVAGALAMAALATEARAQSAFDRSIETVAVLPDTSAPARMSSHRVIVPIRITKHAATSVPLNVSTEVEVHVNGTPVASQVLDLTLNPGDLGGCTDGTGCGGSCGSYTEAGLNAALLCLAESCGDSGCDCSCRTPPIVADFPGIPLQEGDTLLILIKPATQDGGEPEADTSNDTRSLTFDGDPIFWERRISDVTLKRGATGETILEFDVSVFGDTAEQDGHLAWSVLILLNGVEVNSNVACDGLFIAAPGGCATCSDLCNVADCNGSPVTLTCTFRSIFDTLDCYCDVTTPQAFVIPEALTPDDEVRIVLKPAPGALPELPGFEDDEETVRPNPCIGDFDGNGQVDAGDLSVLLAQWGEVGGVADFDGGGVGASDLSILLANWGPCFPV